MIVEKANPAKVGKKFVQDIFFVSVSQISRRLISFAANLYLLRLLSPDAIGKFVILQFFTLLIPNFVGIGLNMAMIKNAKTSTPDSQRSIFTFQIFVSSALAILLLLSTGMIRRYYNDGDYISRYLPWMLCLIPFFVCKQFLISRWQIELDFRKTTKADMIEHAGYLFLAILLCQFLNPLASLAISYVASQLISGIFLAYGFSQWSIFRPNFKWEEVKPMVKFGSYVQMGNICIQITESMLPIVLGKFGGPAALGLVNWAMRLVWLPLSITNYFDSIAFATFCRIDVHRRRYRWLLANLSQGMLAFCGSYLLILNLFFPELILHVFGRQWEGSRSMIACFSTYIFTYAACTTIVQSIFAKNGSKFLFRASFANMIASWTIGVACIYFGSVRGYSFFYLLLNAYSFVIFRHGLDLAQMHWKSIFLRPTAALAFTTILVFMYKLLVPFSGAPTGQVILEIAATVLICGGLHAFFWAWAALRPFYREKTRARNLIYLKKDSLPKAS